MKSFLLLMLAGCFLMQNTRSQNIGINATGASPHPSAMLDVSASDKGMLIPRTSSGSRIAIVNPAKGLMVYDTTTSSFWYHNGAAWTELSKGTTGSGGSYWTANGIHIYNNNTGNVGIGTNSPNTKLTVQTPINSLGFRHIGGADSIIVTEGIGGVSASMGTSTNHAFRLVAHDTSRMNIYPTGEVVVGDNNAGSFGKFSVATLNNSYGISHLGEGGNVLATRMGGTSAGIGTFSNTNMRIFSNGNSAVFINASNGYVGLGGDFPASKLQIGSVGTTGYAGNDLAIGNGIDALGIFQSTSTLIGSTTNIAFNPGNGTGYIGINVNAPQNKLQIGSVGTSGFATNDLAIGNGTNAMAIFQDNTQTLIGSTTDIVLKPRNNGAGKVGINTNTPRAPLDVVSTSNVNALNVAYSYLKYTINDPIDNSNDNPVPEVSIMASGRVYAHEFDAYSDARIKDVAGISNAAEDLQTINALHIINYTMKDRMVHGSKRYKKVIAQEVEKVYPQIVSKHTDFIPNVYQLTNKITKASNGYLLSFSALHHIDSAAKKLQALISNEGGMQSFDIVAIPSANEVVINAPDIKGDKIFVYGEEVNDFRTVDYEGLTTLNISATQEISRLLKKQAATIVQQQKQLLYQQKQTAYLEKRLAAIEKKASVTNKIN